MNIPEQRTFQMKNSTTSPIPSVFSTHEESIIFAALDLIEEKRLKREGGFLLEEGDFRRYLMLRFAGLTYEQGHVLYLNNSRQLLAAEVEFFGNQNSVTWDMRKVVARALALGAEHLVFAHNHPNDSMLPSEQDLQHLDWAVSALKPLNINLLDSYVVTSFGITSIKDRKRRLDEAYQAERHEEYERRSAARKAKIAATKAAKRASAAG